MKVGSSSSVEVKTAYSIPLGNSAEYYLAHKWDRNILPLRPRVDREVITMKVTLPSQKLQGWSSRKLVWRKTYPSAEMQTVYSIAPADSEKFERDRDDWAGKLGTNTHTHTHTHIYIYIYIYIERERERERKTDRQRMKESRYNKTMKSNIFIRLFHLYSISFNIYMIEWLIDWF